MDFPQGGTLPTLVVFPDSVALAINFLRAAVATRDPAVVAVGSEVPNPRPAKFVVVRKTGGQRRNVVIDSPRLTLDCWAATAEAASDLAELCRALLYATRGTSDLGAMVYLVEELADPAPLQDVSDQPRSSFTLQLSLRGVAA